MKKWLTIIISVSILSFYAAYLFQDKFMFYPETQYKSPQYVNTTMFVENKLKMNDGTEVMTWYFQGAPDKPVIFYFHGNSGQISKFACDMVPFTIMQYSVVMSEYRGFGSTQGKLTQQNVFDDATQIYDYYKDKLNFNKTIFYGYSFGCAVTAGLTQRRMPDGIILVAPFTSFLKEIQDKFVPFASLILKDKYPSDQYLKNITCPIILLHGKKDKMISFKHSQELYKIIPVEDKTLVILDKSDHHGIYFNGDALPAITDWLNSHF